MRLRSTAPLDELELRHAVACLKIKLTPRVTRAETHIFNLLPIFEDVWKTKQDAKRVNCDIDLSRKAFHRRCRREHLFRGSGLQKEELRALGYGHPSHQVFKIGKSAQ